MTTISREFSFNGDTLESRIRIATDLSLTPILEKFGTGSATRRLRSPDERCARG